MITLPRFVLAAVLVGTPVSPHQASTPTASLRFDVASIRPSAPGESGFVKALPGGHGYTALNISVKLMISVMYRVPIGQIEGGPDWMNSDRYDVEARADGRYSLDDLHVMYQNLLADRFHLQLHTVSRPGNVYALTVEKPGKLTINQTDENFDIPITFATGGSVVGRRVPMPYFCWWLGQQMQRDKRPVVDQTGLRDLYDFTFAFAPEPPPGVDPKDLQALPDRPSLLVALRDELGLKLTPQKGPVPYLVIDHVERPTEN